MPTYEYRCRTCHTVFEQRRPMAAADDPVSCPDGHRGAVRLLSVFAPVGGSGDAEVPAGPCGGSCACYPS